MNVTRKDFLRGAASILGAAALSSDAVGGTRNISETVGDKSQKPTGIVSKEGFPPTERKGPKRGVSIYSYNNEFGVSVTLEDCLAELQDLTTPGQKIGLEILAEGHIENYPNPSTAWIDNFHKLCDKYDCIPVEYGHWIDSKLYHEGPDDLLSTKESADELIADFKLGSLLGFTRGRTKVGVLDNGLKPVKNWKDIIKAGLPVAEKHNFRMLTEFHSPTPLKSAEMDEYMEFITKENCNPWFALNIDFSVFQVKPYARPARDGSAWAAANKSKFPLSVPEDMIPIMPYIHCCHAKFNDMNDDCQETTIPYAEILKVLADNGYDSYMMSEYEGEDKVTGGAWSAVRKQHVFQYRDGANRFSKTDKHPCCSITEVATHGPI